MDNNRLPEFVLQYKEKVYKYTGRPFKRWYQNIFDPNAQMANYDENRLYMHLFLKVNSTLPYVHSMVLKYSETFDSTLCT
jgi:hypothetical protein